MVACALCICLATIFWCIAILRRRRKSPDRFLAALIGAICVAQGMRLLRAAGFIALPESFGLEPFADLMVTGLYLISIVILRISAIERDSTEVRLRLVEANDQRRVGPVVSLDPQDESVTDIILGSNPLATVGLDKSGVVIYWNAAAERLLGWRADEVLGKASPLALSSPMRTKSGNLVRAECWVSAIHDSLGHPCGTVHMLAPLITQPQASETKALPCDAPALAC